MVVVLILTRKYHRDGVWVTRLTEALRAARATTTKVRILAVEDLLQTATDPVRLLLREQEHSQEQERQLLLVNRVSDAADPSTVKFTVSLLQAAKLFDRITVWNGPTSYSLCVSKWCHHVVLDRAGLRSPPTRVISAKESEFLMTEEASRLPPFPLLVKPNAGGFGTGIHRVENMRELQNALVNATIQRDNIAVEPILLQTYMEPKDRLIYRVWFLEGRVQCAVTRRVTTPSQEEDGAAVAANEFTSGCTAGGVCRRGVQRPTPATATTSSSDAAFRAWKVPDEVADEVQRIVQVLDDADAGSVEFLYGREDNQRYYFDVNLLSTLPLPETISDTDEVWSPDYDPWNELAAAILAAKK